MGTRALVPAAAMAALVAVSAVMEAAAAATTYTVGAPDGLWDMQTDYAQWVKTRTFHPGDKISELLFFFFSFFLILVYVDLLYVLSDHILWDDVAVFTYSPELHDVVEVTKAGYDACSSANNISAFRSGNDVVALADVGTRYFLCGLTGHCDSGMKIRIDVVAAAAPGPAAAAAGPSSSSASRAAAASSAGIAAACLLLQHAVVIARLLW
ncbi:hypothetical protein SEVIR_6G069300v4 [Setaria viridis]